jgi:hypothetical protein
MADLFTRRESREILTIGLGTLAVFTLSFLGLFYFLGREERALREARRYLTDEQRVRLGQTLRITNPPAIAITCPVDASTACEHRNEFIEVFREAGWQVTEGYVTPTAPPVGLWIVVQDAKAPPPVAAFLTGALEEIGLRWQIETDPGLLPGSVLLHVGWKE